MSHSRRLEIRVLGLLMAMVLGPSLAGADESAHLLRWIPSSDPDVAGYIVRYRDVTWPKGYSFWVDAQEPDSEGLISGTLPERRGGSQYEITLTAVDAVGNESALSNSIFIDSGACDATVCPGDGVPDWEDNCPKHMNFDQADADGDYYGDVCDNCVEVWNTQRNAEDYDEDPSQPGVQRFGNACDADLNGDFTVNTADAVIFSVCWGLSVFDYPMCAMADLDGNWKIEVPDDALFLAQFGGPPGPGSTDPVLVPGACEVAVCAGDGIDDAEDNCPSTFNPDQLDADGDLVGDACDNCVAVFNPDQADADAGSDDDASLTGVQHYGDACDRDLDGNGVIGSSDLYAVLLPCLGEDVAAVPSCAVADLDGDGSVDSTDFYAILLDFGSVPGPGDTEP